MRQLALDGSELRDGEQVLVRLEREGRSGAGALAQTAGGTWRFAGEGVVRPGVVVSDEDSGDEVATLNPKGLSGVKGELNVGGDAYTYETNRAGTRWTLLGHDGTALITVDADGAVVADDDASDLLLAVATYCAIQNAAVAAASI